jgi:hypothetical protein
VTSNLRSLEHPSNLEQLNSGCSRDIGISFPLLAWSSFYMIPATFRRPLGIALMITRQHTSSWQEAHRTMSIADIVPIMISNIPSSDSGTDISLTASLRLQYPFPISFVALALYRRFGEGAPQAQGEVASVSQQRRVSR